jgi:hypothetical protein
MDRYYVWEIISYAWSEIGIDDKDCMALVKKGAIAPEHLPDVDRIVFRDVCASFAVDSFLIFPLMLWMLMPDWGYSEEYLRERIERWHSRPYWKNFLNPLRWLGYPLAILAALRYRSMLRRCVRASAVG